MKSLRSQKNLKSFKFMLSEGGKGMKKKGLISMVVAAALVGGVGIAQAANTASVTVGVDNSTTTAAVSLAGGSPVKNVVVSEGDLKVQDDYLYLDNITISTSASTLPTYSGTVTIKVSDPSKYVLYPTTTEYVVCDNGTKNIISKGGVLSSDNSSMYFTLLDNTSLTIGAGEKCYIAPDETLVGNSEMLIKVKKGASGDGIIEYSLTGSDGVTTLESGSSQSFFTVGKVLTAKISTPLSKEISATNSATFTDGSNTDTLKIDVKPVSSYVLQTAESDNLTFTLNGDTPISDAKVDEVVNAKCVGSNDNKTITCETPADNYTGAYTIIYTADNSTGSIAQTQKFTLDTIFNTKSGTNIGKTNVLTGADAGSWLLSGYTALVPKVAYGYGWHTYIELEFTGSDFPTTLKIGIPGTTCSYEKSISVGDAQRVMISSDEIYTQLENQGCDLSKYEVDPTNKIYQFPVSINMPKAQGVTGFASVYSPSGNVMRVPMYGGASVTSYGLDVASEPPANK